MNLSELTDRLVNLPDLLKGLYDLNADFEYDASGNLTKITLTVKDKEGNTRTVTITLSYDASGNLTNITKTISYR